MESVMNIIIIIIVITFIIIITEHAMLDRWHLVAPPSDNPSVGFQMHLVARQDIPEGQEILLSYGDRNNDDFFLHYGFVPLRNPHDDAVLFQDLTDALDWHYEHFKPEVRCAAPSCAVLCCAVLCCAVLCSVLQCIAGSAVC